MTPHIRKIAAGALLGVVALTSGTARADERTEARAHFKKGMADIADGHYDGGIDELKKAYDILPHPNVLYNIARAYVDQGDLENAVSYYKKYLEGNPKDRDEVAQIVAALEARIRKQQAELLESEQAQTTPAGATPSGPGAAGGPGGPGAGPAGPGGPGAGQGVTAGGPGGPGAGAVPGAKGAKPGANVAGAGVGPALPEGGLKTEEVFEETVVTASKSAQSPLDAPNSTSIITEQDIRLSGITKIPELLRRLAGVDIMETTGSQTEVSLRGFNQRLSNKVLVLVNGRSVYVDLLGATIWGLLSIGVEDIERIEVVRGPGSALYGADAFNGVINIITKAPGEGGSGFNVGYGTNNETHGTAYASGREKELAWRLSAGYDYLPRWSREVPPGRQDLTLATPDQNTSQETFRLDGTVTRQIGQDVTVGVQGGYVNGSDEFLGVGPINDVVVPSFYNADITAFLHSKHFEVRTFLTRTEGADSLNATTIGQSLLPARFNLNVLDGEAQYIDQFSTGSDINHDLHLGVDYRLKEVTWAYLAQTETENHAGFFVHDEVKLGKHFAIVGDYRADYVPYLNSIVQSPRASLLFHPSDQSTIRAIVGTAFRTPTFLESYVNLPIVLPLQGASTLSQGAPADQPSFKLQPEQNFSTELGYLNSESDYFTLDTAIFYNHVDNLIDVIANRSVTPSDLGNAGIGSFNPSSATYNVFIGGFENECQQFKVYGGELGARVFPAEGLDLYANTTLMSVNQDNSNCSQEQLNLIANDARTSAVKVNAGVQLRTKVGIDGSLDFHYVSPQDWAEQVVDLQRQQIVYQSFHLSDYELVNLSVGYRFLRNQAEIRGVAFNLLDDEHREHPFGQVVGRSMMGFLSYRF